VKGLTRYQKLGIWWTLAGLALFGYLIYRTGVSTIVNSVASFGAYFIILIFLTGVSLLELFKLRLMGEAVADLTFAGPFLGEPVKAMAMRTRMPLSFSLSSVVVENLVYSLSVILFVLSGVLILLGWITVPEKVRVASLLGGVALCLPVLIAYLIISRRWFLITGLLGWLDRRKLNWKFLERSEERVKQFEESVYGFYGKDRARFWGVTALELLSNLTNVIEAYLILGQLTGNYSWSVAYLIESLNRVTNAVFVLVPMQVGVDEGGSALALNYLGFDPATGVSVAIIRKIRILFWVAIGLIFTARYSLSSGLSAGPAASPAGASDDAIE
jgi:uncharacterized membrane protein YbhN (UPF0104 family)